jgi:hypothetical protein
MLPQLTPNFALPPTSTNDLINEKIFSILLFHPWKDSINCTHCIRSNHNSIQLFEYKNLTSQYFIINARTRSQLGDIRWMSYKSYINKYCMGYNWLTRITLLPVTSVDISLLRSYLKKMQSGFYMLMWVDQRTVQQDTLNL